MNDMNERKSHMKFEAHKEGAVIDLFAKLRKMDRDGTMLWERQIDSVVENLFEKWGIYEFNVNRDAYTGLVLECRSHSLGDVVLKMYPPFLSRRYIKESYIMSTLKDYPQAPLLAVDKNSNAMLLKRIFPGDYIDYSIDREDIAAMFISMNEDKVALADVNDKPEEIKGVVEQTEDEYTVACQYDYYPGLIKYLLECAKTIYSKNFAKEEKCILHGDAYYKNALRSHEGIRVIDPVGYADAFIFEYMPLLTYELVMHTESEEYRDQYLQMKEFFSSFTDTYKFDAATFVFLVKQLVPSIYEANDDYKRANLYLELIRDLFLDENDKLIPDRIYKHEADR